jgi:hypothetical protein
MPEATVHKADRPETGKDNVWPTGKICPVKAIAQTSGMQRPSKHKFRSGVLPLDAGHHPRSRCSIYDVGHGEAFTFKTEPGKT